MPKSTTTPADEAAIRDRAYFLWEADGRPDGLHDHYWLVAVAEMTSMASSTTVAKPKAKAADAKPAKPDGKSRSKAADARPAKAAKQKAEAAAPARKAATKPRAAVPVTKAAKKT